jgi:hypothetical protein
LVIPKPAAMGKCPSLKRVRGILCPLKDALQQNAISIPTPKSPVPCLEKGKYSIEINKLQTECPALAVKSQGKTD